MTTLYEDDTTGEQYENIELQRNGYSNGLKEVGISVDGVLYDSIEYHPEDADFEELRRALHEMVNETVETEMEAARMEANDD